MTKVTSRHRRRCRTPSAAPTLPPAASVPLVAVSPVAPASATIADPGASRDAQSASGAGSAPPPPPPPPTMASKQKADSGGAAPRSRRALLTVVVALIVVAALIGAGFLVANRGNGKSHSTAAAPPPPKSGLWHALPSAPTARQQVGATVSNGKLWVLGGLATVGASTAKVEAYDPASRQWTSGPDLPLPLHHLMAVTYHNQLVVMGGWVPSGGDVEANVSKRVYTLENNKWTELAPMLAPRAAGAAAVVGDDIVVSGGQANHQLVKDTEMFDGTKWTEIAPLPTPRDHLAAVSDGRYYYAIGGRMLSSDKNSGAFERYDPVANTWQALHNLPTPRGGLGAAVVGGQIVTAGGESPTGVYGNVEAYNLSSNTWLNLPSMTTPRHGLALLSVGTTLYAIDGALAAGHTHSTNLNEALNLSSFAKTTAVWSELPSAPTARQQAGSTVLNGTLWILGGLTTVGASTAKVEGYDPVIQEWKTAPDLPLPLHHLMAVTYRSQLVVMGGWVPSGGDVEANVSKRVFELENNKWTELPPMLVPRAAGAAAVVGDDIIVSGGQANHQLVKDTEMFDGTKWKEIAPLPTPRDHLAAVSDGHFYYAIGGRMLSSDKNSGAFERYDPKTNKWSELSALPTPRGGLGAALIGGQIVTAGGESPTGVYGNVEAYSLSSNTWSLLPSMKTPRHGLAVLSAGPAGKTLYAIDGALAAGHTHSTNINEALNLG